MKNFCRLDFFMAREGEFACCVYLAIDIHCSKKQFSIMICEANDVSFELQNDIIVFIVLSVQLSGRSPIICPG